MLLLAAVVAIVLVGLKMYPQKVQQSVNGYLTSAAGEIMGDPPKIPGDWSAWVPDGLGCVRTGCDTGGIHYTRLCITQERPCIGRIEKTEPCNVTSCCCYMLDSDWGGVGGGVPECDAFCGGGGAGCSCAVDDDGGSGW